MNCAPILKKRAGGTPPRPWPPPAFSQSGPKRVLMLVTGLTFIIEAGGQVERHALDRPGVLRVGPHVGDEPFPSRVGCRIDRDLPRHAIAHGQRGVEAGPEGRVGPAFGMLNPTLKACEPVTYDNDAL